MGLLNIQYFDTTAWDYPYYLRGSTDKLDKLNHAKCAEKESETTKIMQKKGTIPSSARIVFRDDADLMYAENILVNNALDIQLQRAKELTKTRETNVARDVNTGEVTLDTKMYVTSITPPPNIANEQKTPATHSVKDVNKLSSTEKVKLETTTGVKIDSDAALKQAKDLIISNSRSKQVGVTGTKKEGTGLITSDVKTTNTIDKLVAQIAAIEATRADCPDWLGCPLPDINFTRLKEQLESLLSLKQFTAMFEKAKELVEKGLYTVSQFAAWLKCPTYVFKKGLAGLQTLNEIGVYVSGLQNTEYMKVFKETVNEMGVSKLLRDTNSKDSFFKTLGSSSSKQHISFTEYVDLIRAFKDGGVDFTPRALFSPFENEEDDAYYQNNARYDFSDMLAIESSFGYKVESTSNSKRKTNDAVNNNNVNYFASAIAKAQEDDAEEGSVAVDIGKTTTLISMNRSLAAQTAAGNFPETTIAKEDEFVRFSSYAYPNTNMEELETFSRNETVVSYIEQKQKAVAVSDALYVGDVSTAKTLGGVDIIYQTQEKLGNIFWKPGSIQDHYRSIYGKIEQSALA